MIIIFKIQKNNSTRIEFLIYIFFIYKNTSREKSDLILNHIAYFNSYGASTLHELLNCLLKEIRASYGVDVFIDKKWTYNTIYMIFCQLAQ
jgi:type IV secretory pathway VirB6-like protein